MFKDDLEAKELVALFEKNIPKTLSMIIYAVLIALFSFFISAFFLSIDNVVRAEGIVRPEAQECVIYNLKTALVKRLFCFENRMVKKGDMLYELETNTEIKRKNYLIKERLKIEERLKLLDRLEKCIELSENLFNDSETEFFNMFERFKCEYESKLLQLNTTIEKYNNYKEVEDLVSKATLNKLEIRIELLQKELKAIKCSSIIKMKKDKIDCSSRINELYGAIAELEEEISKSLIKAPLDGTISMFKQLNIGELVNNGERVMAIIPKGENFRVRLNVSNRDITAIKLGQKVKCKVYSTFHSSSLVVDAYIIKVPIDIKDDSRYYEAEALVNFNLNNRTGMVGKLKNGMVCETYIMVKKEKLIDFILNKLGFMSKNDNTFA